MEIQLFKQEQYNKMLSRGKTQEFYGKVLVITVKKIRTALNIAETVIPATFFMLSVLGSVIYKIMGDKELMRITLRD